MRIQKERSVIFYLTVMFLITLVSQSASAYFSIEDMNEACHADAFMLTTDYESERAGNFMVPAGQSRELVLNDLSSRCSSYINIDQNIFVNVDFPFLKGNDTDLFVRNKMKLEVIDIATGQDLGDLAISQGGDACYGGANTMFIYPSLLSSVLRPVKIRITNGGKKNHSLALSVFYSNFQYSNQCVRIRAASQK